MTETTRTALGLQGERRIFGWGIRSEPIDTIVSYCRDIQLVSRSDGSRDLDVSDGFAALEQDLRTALGTALGADPLNIGFGFEGLRIVSEETDRLMLRERLRGAIVQVLRADPRVVSVTRVLIGNEIKAFEAGQTSPPHAAGEYGVLAIEASFRILGGEEARLALGSTLAGA